MSTNSSIAIKIGDKVTSIYCHWDGYLEHNGDILLRRYNSEILAKGLVQLGNISSLGETIAETRYYDRDMERENEKATELDFRDYIEKVVIQEYNYIYDVAKGEWFVCEVDYDELTDSWERSAFKRLRYELERVKKED